MSTPLLAALRARYRNLRYGFLFLPGLIALTFVALALGLTAVDRSGGSHGVGVGFGGDAQAARTLLSTIAGSLITVAGLTFSVTIVALQLVSQQFTPRALRTFLGDRLNQVVIGCFVGVFLYCLLVLRAVRGAQGPGVEFVPGLSIAVGIALGAVALGLLLVFIHHMAQSIQVSTMTSAIARGTLATLDRLYPEPFGQGAQEPADALLQRWRGGQEPIRVLPARPGYVQSVALDDLPRTEGSAALRAHVCVAPGDFVTAESTLAEIWAAGGERFRDALRAAIAVADERDLLQDPAYGLRQLADICIKALSPSVNDPTTGVTCIRHMQGILELLVDRALPPGVRRYGDRGPIVVARRVGFDELVDIALVQPSRYAAADARVASTLLAATHALVRRAVAVGARQRVACLLDAADRIAGPAIERAATAHDRAQLERGIHAVRSAAGG